MGAPGARSASFTTRAGARAEPMSVPIRTRMLVDDADSAATFSRRLVGRSCMSRRAPLLCEVALVARRRGLSSVPPSGRSRCRSTAMRSAVEIPRAACPRALRPLGIASASARSASSRVVVGITAGSLMRSATVGVAIFILRRAEELLLDGVGGESLGRRRRLVAGAPRDLVNPRRRLGVWHPEITALGGELCHVVIEPSSSSPRACGSLRCRS